MANRRWKSNGLASCAGLWPVLRNCLLAVLALLATPLILAQDRQREIDVSGGGPKKKPAPKAPAAMGSAPQGYSVPNDVQERHEELLAWAMEVPGAVDENLALYLSYWELARSHMELYAQFGKLRVFSAYLEKVDRYFASLGSGKTACARADLDGAKKTLEDRWYRLSSLLEGAGNRFEGSYVYVLANSSLETLDTSSDSAAAVAPPAQEKLDASGYSRGRARGDYSLRLLPFRGLSSDAGTFYGNRVPSLQATLNEQVAEALQGPQASGRAIDTIQGQLKLETDRMRLIGYVLLQVQLIRTIVDHESATTTTSRAIRSLHSQIDKCHASMSIATEAAGESKHLKEIYSKLGVELTKIERQLDTISKFRFEDPRLLKALNGWRLKNDVADSEIKGVLEEMASDLRIGLSLRRPEWNQLNRMAQLEAELNPRN